MSQPRSNFFKDFITARLEDIRNAQSTLSVEFATERVRGMTEGALACAGISEDELDRLIDLAKNAREYRTQELFSALPAHSIRHPRTVQGANA